MNEKLLEQIAASLKFIEKAAQEYLDRLPPKQWIDENGRQFTRVTLRVPSDGGAKP